MAGWKLRKDKAQPDAEPQAAAEEATAGRGAEIYSAPVGFEEHDEEQSVMVGYAPAPSFKPDMETGDAPHFEGEDGPLKPMDYSVPFNEDLLPMSAAPIIAAPPPDDVAPQIEAPPAEAGMAALTTPSFDTSAAAPGEEAGDFTSTLRMSREELAAAFTPPAPTGIPPVAPFIIDAPLVAPPAEDAPPRLVVRMGRLSAAFDVTKEVTIIGRPDSEMHYYPDIEIDLDDAVSRRHAEIIRRNGAYSIVDTGSTNGTLLNGETLLAHEERPLAHGDRIRVGERTEIIFE